jgi:oligosaccharyltransferase complex subunit beta
MTHELVISEWYDGKWYYIYLNVNCRNPFVARDIQFQAVMLDPYIIKTMTPQKQLDSSSTKYLVFYKLPDRYGVFSLKVDYARHGYSFVSYVDTVEVRPFRHDEYARFLSVAYPYYANSFSLLFGFLLISSLFLFHVDPVKKEKKN